MELLANTSGTNAAVKTRHYAWVFACFFLITFLVYLPALHSKFVADFIDMVFNIRKRPPLSDLSHGIVFDFVNRFVFQAWLKLFGYNAWAWHFLQCFLHSLNAVLFYAITKVILNHFNYIKVDRTSLLIALCFLLSPYHTEPVVWGGDINYLLVTNFIFIHLLAFMCFVRSPKLKYAAIAVISLLLGSFTHELAWFLLPADLIVAFTLLPTLRDVFSKSNLNLWAISIVAMGLYLGNKILSGNLVGHYGSSVHLRFHLKELVPAFFKYILKILCLVNFLPGGLTGQIYGHLDANVAVIILSLLFLSGALLLFRYLPKYPALKVPVCFFLLFALFVFPVLNLYFPYWIPIDGDRYCYITSAFLIAAGVTALYAVNAWLSVLSTSIYLAFSVYFLANNIESWHQAGTLMATLENEYQWKNAPHVYILNLPDDFRGAYMYRSLQDPNLFAESFIKYGPDIPASDRITPVIGYNLNAPTDSVIVEVSGKDELHVTLSAWGTWFWRKAEGAPNEYDDKLTKLRVDEWGHSFKVTFKQRQPGDVFLYCANGHWHEVSNF